MITILLYCLAMLFLFFAGAVVPIWSIIDCAISKRSNGSKVAWIIALLIFFGIPSLVYGFFAQSKALRVLTIAAVALGVVLTAWIASNDEVQGVFIEAIKQGRSDTSA